MVPLILCFDIDEGEWVVSYNGYSNPWGKNCSTRWIGSWLGPRASLDVAKEEILLCQLQYSLQ